ncbi:MAG: hypothetical protein FJ253_11000 [Phycisphaerae bacterium]|nr:hypothetical protein [Phycisphaerae bacterium]
MNALAAALAAHRLGADARAISAGLAAVSASEMRFVRQAIDGIEVVNDAYNANPESMRASIRAFAESSSAAQRRVVVLGDMLELGDAAESLHRELGEWLPEAIAGGPPELAIFVGPLSAAASRAFARAAPESESLHLPDAGAASAEALRAVLRAGDSVLFKASRGVALERLIAALAAPGAGAGAGAVAGARSSAESETRAGPRPRAGGSR